MIDAERHSGVLPAGAALVLGLCLVASDVMAATTQPPVRIETSSPALPSHHERGLVYFPPGPAAVETEPLYEGITILADHPAVQAKIRYFQAMIPARVQKWLNRFDQYRPLVEPVFAQFGLPRELIYLSLVESGFNP